MDMAQLHTHAEMLAQQAGLGPVSAISPVMAGGNNRVYRMDCSDQSPPRSVLLKQYFRSRGDRDRLGSEFAFVLYASARGLPVPMPIACDQVNGLGLYEFIDGRGLQPREVAADHVRQALDFLVRLNVDHKGAEQLQAGAESCFTPMAHISVVDRRLARLHSVAGEAGEFIMVELIPAWIKVRNQAQSALRGMAELSANQRIVSPSDFGFHNALLTNNERLVFIDFEYAGWDDPAKAVCDFFCQPAVPAPREELAQFTRTLAEQSWADEHLAVRVAALLPVYEVKWVTIMLNEFLPSGSLRRAFAAGEGDEEERRRIQLAKAKVALAKIA